MFEWLKKKFKKISVLADIVEEETTRMQRTPYDFLAQAAIRKPMEQAGYKYVGNPGNADATHAGSYRS